MLEKYATYEGLQATIKELETLSPEKARQVLLNPDTPAVILYVAARAFYGPTVAAYEPETLWSLVDMPPGNRDKLMAALTLQVFPSFYWDLRVFGHTCLAFNDQAAFTELVPKPLPEHLCYAIFTAQLLFQLDSEAIPEFDAEVAAYAAACLVHEGLVFAPPLMDFTEDHLTRLLSPEGRKLHAEMKNMGDEPHTKRDIASALGVQLARQEQVRDYLEAQIKILATHINTLKP